MGRMVLPTANWESLCHRDVKRGVGGEISVVHSQNHGNKKGSRNHKGKGFSE